MPIASEELSEFHNEFFLLFNIAVGGKWSGRPDETTTFPQYMYVDWVRVYQK
jgi:beta-glucanase (GH16 family)